MRRNALCVVAVLTVLPLLLAGSCDTPAKRDQETACVGAGGVIVATDIGEGRYACIVGDGLRVVVP